MASRSTRSRNAGRSAALVTPLMRAQLCLEISQQPARIDRAAAGCQVDQQVEVAGRIGLATRDRAENAHIARTAPRR